MIDSDFSGADRGTIKEYMETRFGKENVCSVGTYSTFKPKGMIKDFAKLFDMDFSQANSVTFKLHLGDDKLIDILRRAQTEPVLKEFLKKNPDIFYMMPTILDQQKTEGLHACAMIVTPDVMSGPEWMPMRVAKGQLVTQWSGGECDDAGFLKNDILGLLQLSKFTDILSLARENGKDIPDIYNLPDDDREVFRFFSNGWTGDVFQMGSDGMTSHVKSLKPTSLDDVIALMALYRPGPMEYIPSFIKRKHGQEKIEYDIPIMEKYLSETYGVTVYQEQVMMLSQELAGFTSGEADNLRKAMGKKQISVLDKMKPKFIKQASAKGYDLIKLEKVWKDWEKFASYAFNKSHSAAYGITAYISQYLKVHFPIEYWTVALDYADEDKTSVFLSEILQSKSINLSAIDINKSHSVMTSDLETSTIFWGISSIKGIGEDTADQIISERNNNGEYLGLEDFLKRSIYKGSKVKKTAVEGLIASGGFDEIEGVSEGFENNRSSLIQKYRTACKVKVANVSRDPYSNENIETVWYWKMRQKDLTGLSFINYEHIAEEQGCGNNFLTTRDLNNRQQGGIFKSFGGYVTLCKVGNTKKGKYARLIVENNYKLHKVIMWPEEYENFKDQLKGCEKKIILFSAELKYDAKFTKGNQFTFKGNSFLKVL